MTSLPSTAPSLLLVAGACSVSMLGLPSATSPRQQHVSPWRAVCIYCVSEHHCITVSTTKLFPMPIFTGPDVATPSLSAVTGDIMALMLTKTRVV